MGGHHDAGSCVGVDHGVLDEIADRHAQLARIAQHPTPGRARDGQGHVVSVGVDPAAVDGFGQHVVDLDDLGLGQRIVRLQAGELDDLADQIGQSSRLDPHPGREATHRLRVVGRILHGLGEQRDGSDGRLQLVAGVGDEVPARLLDPPCGGLVVGEHHDQILAQRCDVHDQVRRRREGPAVDLQILRAWPAVPAHLADQVQQLGRGDPGGPDQAEIACGLGRFDHLVVRTDDHPCRAVHGENLRYTARHGRLGLGEGLLRIRGRPATSKDQRADRDAQNQRHDHQQDVRRAHS